MKNKRLFVTVFHSFISKNFLNTEAFAAVKADPSIEIFLLVPNIKENFFRENYESERVKVVGVDTQHINSYRSVRLFSKLTKLMMSSVYLAYKKREAMDAGRPPLSWAKFAFETLLTFIFGDIKATRDVFRAAFAAFVCVPEAVRLIEEYKPTALFTTDIFDESDLLFANEFKKRQIPILGMVRSWDNCYSKGLLRILPDELLVNNSTLAEEAAVLHGMPKNKIEVVGLPQHDSFVNEKRASREEFCRSMGLDPNRPYILFAPAGSILSDRDGELMEIMVNARDQGRIPAETQFLVRNHPNHPADLSAFEGRPGVVIENPGKVFNKKNPKDTELTREDNRHLADSLYHSALVIWVATTLGLDALVFDKPQIAVNFDAGMPKPYHLSVRRYHDENHMKKMLDLGGVSVAHDKNELIDEIGAYLKNPKLRQEGREEMKRQQFYQLDGKAGGRVGEALTRFIASCS